MGLTRDEFYDESRIAIVPTGLCYPGRNPRGGDLPPRPECAPLWADAVVSLLPRIELIVLAGWYAQRRQLGKKAKNSLTETVRCWRDYIPRYIPLPHPSFRNNLWIKQNLWFTEEVVPYLRKRVTELM
jgi:uracil-DNA glycosylase